MGNSSGNRVKGIPPGEKIWTTTRTAEGEVYYTTSKCGDRSMYFLYKDSPEGVKRLGKGGNPKELERKYIK